DAGAMGPDVAALIEMPAGVEEVEAGVVALGGAEVILSPEIDAGGGQSEPGEEKQSRRGRAPRPATARPGRRKRCRPWPGGRRVAAGQRGRHHSVLQLDVQRLTGPDRHRPVRRRGRGFVVFRRATHVVSRLLISAEARRGPGVLHLFLKLGVSGHLTGATKASLPPPRGAGPAAPRAGHPRPRGRAATGPALSVGL